MSEPSTFVLVPGAWHGAWAWHPVGRRLQAAGHRVVALTPPGMALGDDPRGLRLEDAVSYVADIIEHRDLSNVTLVAHSWAGYPVTGAAHRVPERLAKVVYFSAAVPVRGVSMTDELPAPAADFTRAAIEASDDGTISVPFELFSAALMQDEPEDQQRLVFDLLLPQPGGYMLDAIDVDAVADHLGVPTAYVLAQDDHALARPGAEFAERLGVVPTMVPGTHEAHLTHPDAVAHALLTV